MGGDLLPRAIEMAREVRRGEARYSVNAIYNASCGRMDVYRHAMLEAAYITPSSDVASRFCPVCRYDFKTDAPRRSVVGDGFPLPLTEADLTDEERRMVAWVTRAAAPRTHPTIEGEDR